ncbi:F-box/kelch-repeat protein At3g06240-like [Papaver somniferum]|uniref:F-box/kelch-repeat protein At3g06240-like n=1 Tax=Papaver somniferum TaxID=3469 RepID=UPI000E702B53|nr:F-box/kelch-repeat protein At3g06240-like [Papaver somniferum]
MEYNSLFSSLTSSSIETYECDEAVEMYYPLISADNGVEILGSCNGLLCVRTSFPGGEDEDAISLWNPSSNEYKELPSSPNHFSREDTGLYGFAYDSQDDDYKVVRVVDYYYNNYYDTGSDIEVYNLRSNSWKDIGPVPYLFPSHKIPGVIVNGVLHWLGAKISEPNFIVIAFAIGTETFKELAVEGLHLPECDENIYNYILGALAGCLCLLFNVFDVQVDVWVMQANGVKESWTKRISITQENITRNNYLTLKWDFKNGEILLMGDDFLFYYDSNRNRDKKVIIRGADLRFVAAENFVPSLVSLNSGTYVERRMLE